ncbi:hypothetical protein CIPAW_12G017500 [Carya illinoinensis]|uniref:Uncharacterized protein n=1 Tax=Carya illinoinensis TaxID=32201 RepID=A0A8T1NUY1_CARIL|nr:hypothetical protein CIPAW_12G017500 [Carya illinoinensis]
MQEVAVYNLCAKSSGSNVETMAELGYTAQCGGSLGWLPWLPRWFLVRNGCCPRREKEGTRLAFSWQRLYFWGAKTKVTLSVISSGGYTRSKVGLWRWYGLGRFFVRRMKPGCISARERPHRSWF